MPEFFKSTSKKPGATKVRKGYKSGGGDWIQGAIKLALNAGSHIYKKS